MAEPSPHEIERIVKPGDLIAGKYLVERVLGVGGMGVVVAATHTQLDQRVAIKLLLPSMLAHEEVVERFQREARAAAKIKSEHVVRVSDVGTLPGGLPYIVMEFLEGRDLGDMLARRGVLPIPLAIDYVLQACEALVEAHAAGIVHRDLKPANLFLARSADDSESVKVLDFGISKNVSAEALQSNPSLTKTTDVFGSPTYMSPEQLKASRDVDMRADIWALGVILYELTTGAPPFPGGTVAEIFGAILHKPAPRLREARKDAPAELERVLLHCLEKDASKRFQNVGDLAEALAPFGSDDARESTARVSRVIRASGPRSRIPNRASDGGGRGSLVDAAELAGAGPAVQASTSALAGAGPTQVSSPDPQRAASPGSATSTSWGHIQPAPRPAASGRTALVAGGALIAAAGGAFLVLQLMKPASPAAGSGPGPTAEVLPAVTSPVPSTVVVPAPLPTASAEPAASAPTAKPSARPAGSSSAASTGLPPAAKVTGKTTASAAPTAAPTAKPTAPPPAGDDGEFGGRR